jgi:hypothetical protein
MTSPTANPSVPWAVGGGADNPIEHARMIPWAIFQGAEGTLGNADLQVVALATPGGSVQINPGGYVIQARGLGQTYESYMGKYGNAVTVNVDPNSTASARSDLVVLRVEDNHVAGEPWSPPASNDTGPYRNIIVVKGVSSTTKSLRDLGNSWSGIALARIDIPAFTSAITNAMIINLRTKVVAPPWSAPPTTIPIVDGGVAPDNAEAFFTKVAPGMAAGTSHDVGAGAIGTWRDWPNVCQWVVPIPKWATVMEIFLVLYSIKTSGSIAASARINIGADALFGPSNDIDVNYTGGPGPENFIVATGGKLAIPSNMRGFNKLFKAQFRTNVGGPTAPGTASYYAASCGDLRVIFKEQP